MRTHLRMVLMAMAAVMLAACATDGSQLSKTAPQQGRFVTDAEYVAYVERKALSRGVEVYWVQPPTRAVAAADTDE